MTTEDDVSKDPNLRLTGQFLLGWAAFSTLLLISYTWGSTSGSDKFWMVFGTGSLMAFAFSALGGFFGFLFGIPRTSQEGSGSPPGQAAGSAGSASDRKGLGVNTNLEQISDWLTKIIVGVGLGELTRIPGKLVDLATFFKPGLNDNLSVSMLLVLNFLIFGFFGSYLLTRMFLARAFSESDQAAAKLRDLVQAATVLASTKGHSVALAAALGTAIDEVRPDTLKEDKRRIFEEFTYNTLYEGPPTGFQKVIQYGRRYLQEEPATPSARIWTNLAAAYGQQYRWESDHENKQEVRDQARNDALAAAKEAIRLEPKMRSLLRMLWDPNDVTKVSAEENDLEAFYNDSEFKELLGG